MNKKQIEKIAKSVKSDKEFRAAIEKVRTEEKKSAIRGLTNTIKITGIVVGAVILAVTVFGIINNSNLTPNVRANVVKVTMQTEKGDIVMELDKGAAPRTVANFIDNIKKGFYNGSYFNRIIKDGIIQGGSPQDGKDPATGEKLNRPGMKDNIDFEITGLKHERWAVAMASSGGKANKFHFNICLSNQPNLDGKGVVFGKVVDGYETLSKLTNVNLRQQVLGSEVIKDDKGVEIQDQMHNAAFYEVSNDEMSRAENQNDVKIIEVLVEE
jgi:cyclophilin family peptidyl-prolyl cis-trans isomerase